MQRRDLVFAPLTLLAACTSKSRLPSLGSIPPFAFRDANGQEFSSSQLSGKVWIADFFFTNCPGPCPRMSNQLSQLQAKFPEYKDLRVISITVDPARDTPEVLNAYAKRYHADPARWIFLTGRKDLIQNLMSEAFFLGHGEVLTEHSTRFVLVDRQMQIRGFYDSFDKDGIEKLSTDIKDLYDRS